MADFRRRGKPVPSKIMADLKSGETMIRLLRFDPTCGETVQKVEEYLGSVESYVIPEGEKLFGKAYAEEWLERLAKARRNLTEEQDESRFIQGLPRNARWIRVKPSEEMPLERLKMMAESSSLSWSFQADGSLLVQGKEESIKNFVLKMTRKYGSKT